MAKGYNLEQTGPQVQEAINKSLNLTTATQGKDGLMSAQDKQKLDSLDSELAGKVDKVPGKGLSTNDYDNTEKGKVASAYQKPVDGIPASDLAEGVIPDTSQFITKTVNDLANYYLKTETYSRSETYTKTEVDALIALIKQFSYQVVSELPEASESTMYKLYLVPSADPQTQNVKDEYITVRSGSEGAYTYAWEQIGSTAIDLDGYVTTTALNTALSAYTTTANLTTLLAAKQDVIADLPNIRSGAAAGATAYQKPSGGIPGSDIASGVIPSVPTISKDISADALSDSKTASPKAVKEYVDEMVDGEFIEAWDGSSEPVVANIPSGVSVEYNSTTYTGTLSASASTKGKVYLVSDGNGEYDRYKTSYDGTNYFWSPLGSTAMILSGYATKAEVTQLQEKVTDLNKSVGEAIPYTLDATNGFYKKDGTTVDSNPYKRGTAIVTGKSLVRIVTNLFGQNVSVVIKDSNDNIVNTIDGHSGDTGYGEYYFITPEDGATILFSCYFFDADSFILFEYNISGYTKALEDIADLQKVNDAAYNYVKPIPIEWVQGSYFGINLQLVAGDSSMSYFEFSNTKAGEKYLIYVSGGGGSFTQGIRNTDNTVYKKWTGVGVDWEIVEIAQDGQAICLSYWNNASGRWNYCLMRIGYTKNEDNIKTIQGQISEIEKSLTQKSVPITFTDGGFYNNTLQVVSWAGGAGHFEYSNTHIGEQYYIYVSGGGGSFYQGVRNPDNSVYKSWNRVGVDEIITITQDGQAICLSQWDAAGWTFKLTKLVYTKTQEEIEQINLRLGGLSSFVSGVAPMGVPVFAYPKFDYNHIIVYGQSFAVGNGPQGNANNIVGNYMLGGTTKSSATKDRNALNQLTNNGGGGIVVQCTNAFNKMWNREHDSKFIATSGGEGAKTIEQLSKGTQYYTDLLTELSSIKAIADNEGKTVGCIAILFIQGESNYSPGDDHTREKTQYKYLVNKLLDDMQADIVSAYGQSEKPIVLMYQTGGQNWVNGKEQNITMAQIELAEDREDVVLGCPTYNVALNTTHHPSGSGYAMIGELMAKHLYNLMSRNIRSEGTHPVYFSKSGNAITIGCFALVPPLVLDTHTCPASTDYGFKVYVDGVATNISSVVVNGNSITITMPNDLDGHIVEVTYAGYTTNLGKGNVCDSDNKYMSWQTYINEDNMEQQPYDVNNRPMTGMRLPLQNFLSNFYKNIDFHFVQHLFVVADGSNAFTPKIYNNSSATPSYVSSETSVATVASNGQISIVGIGYTKITASITVNGATFTDELLLIVTE